MSREGLMRGPLGGSAAHICVDVQRMFAEETEWHAPWMERIRPVVRRLAEHHPERTIFTRFVPAARPARGKGRGSATMIAGRR